jgi:AcrR family transcriptional regulator
MKYQKPGDRKAHILLAAVNVAKKHGYNRITQEQVATEAGITGGLVCHYWKNMENLRAAIVAKALELKIHSILAQGLVAQDPLVANLSGRLKEEVLDEL